MSVVGQDGEQPGAFVRAPVFLPDALVSTVGYHVVEPAPMIHRGIPSPAITFVSSLHDPIATGMSPEHARGPEASLHHTILGGLHTRPSYIAQPRVQTGIHIAVRPLAARALFGVPAGELDELTIEGRDLLGRGVDQLRERLIELPDWRQRFDVVADYLRERFLQATERCRPRPEVAEAWRWIARHRGNGSMAELARHVALSTRQLSTVFRAELGMSPKAVSGLMRFAYARQLVSRRARSDEPVDIATVAHAAGFYDHSHLVRDFQRYVGLSPSSWLAQEHRIIQAGAHQIGEHWVT